MNLDLIFKLLCLTLITLLIACKQHDLHLVTTGEFNEFVHQTGYITDAEQYDWSIVQRTVDEYDILFGINWKCPDGTYKATSSDPVLQVSYNDAIAYCEWSGHRLPSYSEYWQLSSKDNRPINKSSSSILPVDQTNIVGNIWEITTPDNQGRIRLAGGSYLCDDYTCNGTSPSRILYVDQITGNSHIGFAVVK